MQRISWTKKKTNESVRMEIGIEEETLQQTALRRKLGFFGHVMQSDGLEKGKMLAHGERRRRRRGRPRRKWMDEILEVTGMKLAELRDVTTERKQRRGLVKTVARAQRTAQGDLFKSATTQKRSLLQHRDCVGVNLPKPCRQL